MIRVKTFKLEDTDKADEFIAKNKPIAQNGIQLNMGHIVVIYDDGIMHPQYLLRTHQDKLNTELTKKDSAQFNIMFNEAFISKFAPKGYSNKLTDIEVKRLFEKDGVESTKARDLTKIIFAKRNSILQEQANIHDCDLQIACLSEIIKEYK